MSAVQFRPTASTATGVSLADPIDAGVLNPLPVGQGDPSTVSATIANNGTLSGSIDLAGQRLHRLSVDGWTTAAISFQTSPDGVTFNDLFTDSAEYTLASGIVASGRAFVLDQSLFYGVRYLKIRSGISGTTVSQGGLRTFTLVTVAR